MLSLGLIIPSVAGLNEVWSLTVFPIVGAAGGALAGYFALDKPADESTTQEQRAARLEAASVAMLVVGLAGVLPAILVTVKGVRQERQDRWEPTPQIDLRTEKEQRAFETAEAGPGLIRRSRSGLRVAAPGVTFSRQRSSKMQKPHGWVASVTGPRCGFPSRLACFSVPV